MTTWTQTSGVSEDWFSEGTNRYIADGYIARGYFEEQDTTQSWTESSGNSASWAGTSPMTSIWTPTGPLPTTWL